MTQISSASLGMIRYNFVLKRYAPIPGSPDQAVENHVQTATHNTVPSMVSMQLTANSGIFAVYHSHSVNLPKALDKIICGERVVCLELDTKKGVISGTEEIHGQTNLQGNLGETVLGNDTEKTRLPLTGANVKNYLHSVLAWLTGENGHFGNRENFSSAVHDGQIIIEGASSPEEVFDALTELKQRI